MGEMKKNMYSIKKSIAKSLLIIIILLISGCAAKQNYKHIPPYTESAIAEPGKVSTNKTQSIKPVKKEYRIQEGDALLISVWRENDLKEEVIVRPDGRISFPLAGDVPAVGVTFVELKSEITKRLMEYLKDPVVSISLVKSGSSKVIVLGEVTIPGVYPVTGKMTILEAVALAEGFTEDAVASSVIHVREGPDGPEGTRLDLSEVLNKARGNHNIALQSEDIVYVPRSFIGDVNYYARKILTPIAQGVFTIRGIKTIDE